MPAELGQQASSQTARIAEAVTSLRFEQLPPPVVAFAKRLIADTLLVAAAGTTASSSAALRNALPAAPGGSRLWFLGGAGVHAVDATFINTLHAAALDYDSLNRAVHADLVSLPAAWAVAESVGASGRALIAAFVAGSELVSRLSRAATGPSLGWSGTSLYGGLGAAAAAGRLLGLGHAPLRHALGLALSQAAGTQQANLEMALSKRLQPAFAARHGVFSAHLAHAGASAPAQALEGRFGLRRLAQPGDDEAVVRGLWQDWQFFDTGIKPYPVCACSHAAIEACLSLCLAHGLQHGQVRAVTAHISPFMARLVGAPFSLDGDPQVTAQFSLRYHLASVLLRRRLGLAEIEPAALHDPAIAALVPLVQVVIDGHNHEELAPARVVIDGLDGSRHEATCDRVPGTPGHALSADLWHAKLRECAARAEPPLDASKLDALLARIETLDRLDDVRRFWDGWHG